MERRVFPEGNDPKGRPYEDLRWSRFKHFAPGDMYAVLGEHVFPFLRNELARQHGGNDSTYAHHMKDARFTIPTPALLAKVVDLLDIKHKKGAADAKRGQLFTRLARDDRLSGSPWRGRSDRELPFTAGNR